MIMLSIVWSYFMTCCYIMKALLLPQQRCLLQRVPHGSQPVKELEPSQLVAFCSPSHEAGKATAFLFYREEVYVVYPLGLNLPRRIAKAPTRDDSNMLYCDRLHTAEAAAGTAFAAGSSHSWRAHWGSVLKHTPPTRQTGLRSDLRMVEMMEGHL